MKAKFSLLLLSLAVNASAQTLSTNIVSSYAVAERGPHQRLWQQVVSQTNLAGQTIYKTNSYTELATGLCYWNGSQWADASDQIQITLNGAAATNTQHQVAFAANINTTNAITLTTPDSQQMTSQILGLAYFDADADTNVLFAEIQDSIGQLLPSGNQVIYTNAFTNANCDVLFTHRLSGIEQDIIIRQQLPSPSSVGLSGSNIWLQVWTEFPTAPTPTVTENTNDGDSFLDFGAMKMGRGKAFMLGGPSNAVPVIKEWLNSGGRTFLIESVPLNSIAAQIATLPSTAALRGTRPPSGAIRRALASNFPHLQLNHLKLPAPKLAKTSQGPMRLTVANPAAKGFVLDYNLTGSQTNFTFQSDTTYYVTNEVDLYGTNVLEGGTVLKFSTNSAASIILGHATNVVFQTGPYRPVIFTAQDDDSVGAQISGSTGIPTNYYGGTGLKSPYSSLGSPAPWKNLRFSYLRQGMDLEDNNFYLYDVQFVQCQQGIYLDTVWFYLRNALFSNVPTNFYCQPDLEVFDLENVTVHNSSVFCDIAGYEDFTYTGDPGDWPNFYMAITNCLLVNVTNTGPPLGLYGYTDTNTTVILTNDTGVFQTVGAGNHYLATNTYRGCGATNISPTLLADLAQKTTWPPTVIADSIFGSSSTLNQQVSRETNSSVDLGYHYAAIDYALGADVLTNAILTIAADTVIAGFDTNASGFSLAIEEGGQIISQGGPTTPVWIADYRTVQEAYTNCWTKPSLGLLVADWQTNTPGSGINCQFTDFSVLANDTAHLYGLGTNMGPVSFQNCQFEGGSLTSTNATVDLFNCLLERVDATLWANDGNAPQIQNCLFYGGTLDVQFSPTNSLLQNNFFDQTTIADYDSTNYIGTYNAYVTGSDHLTLTNANDVFLTNALSFQTSWLGRFYQPTNSPLINAGSTPAGQLGLYYFTTQTNQQDESNSTVDIGYHYVAVDTNGNPYDTFWLGIPDYLADPNGTGELANWEMVNYGYYGLDPNAYYTGVGGSNGLNNLNDFQYFPDPNVIQFSILATNSFVNSNSVSLQLQITNGTAYYMAVLVNSTNFPNAVWETYTSSNVLVSLGTTNGLYLVWIGLRGYWTNSPQAWAGTFITVQTNAPVITLTNPAAATVTRPVVQLQGYVSETLASFTYDLSNAATVITNQQISITGQFADTNLFAVTTNYFQAYDLFLTNGSNFLTFHATDLAGNTTTTNYVFTLDYSGDTNAPVITVTYPLTNSLIASTNFTLIGYLDDDTATLTVSNATFGPASALVERGGFFSLANIPLTAATNFFTLTATNAAGNSTNIEITVLQSSLTLTVDPLSDGELSQTNFTLTGTVSDSSQNVWVNGTQATVSGNSWSVTLNTPTLPTLQLLVQAGMVWGSPAGDVSLYLPMPPQVQLASFTEDWANSFNDHCDNGDTSHDYTASIAWALNQDGISISRYGTTVLPTNWGAGQLWENSSASSYVFIVDADPTHCVSFTVTTAQIQSLVQLIVPGPAQIGVSQLVRLTATAAAYSSSDDPTGYQPGDTPVLGNQIWYNGQQFAQTATNAYVGELYVTEPAGSVQSLPIQVKDTNNNPLPSASFNMGATNCQLIINWYDIETEETNSVAGRTNTTIVGEFVDLKCMAQSVPTNVPISYRWTVPGSPVKQYTFTFDTNSQSITQYLQPSDLTSNEIQFYWIDGASNLQVSCMVTVGGSSNIAKTYFNVTKPTGTLTSVTTTNIPPVAITTNVETNFNATNILLQYGMNGHIAGKEGISFFFSVTAPSNGGGSFALRQIINNTTQTRILDDSNSTCEYFSGTNLADYNSRFLLLDPTLTSISGGQTQTNTYIGDSPAEFLYFLSSGSNIVTKHGSITNNFSTYLIFKPASGGIWVTLSQLDWNFSGGATKDTNGNWTLDSGYPTPSNNPTGYDSTNLPVWVGNIFANFGFVPCP